MSTAPAGTARSYLYVPDDRPERFAKDAARENVLGALAERAAASSPTGGSDPYGWYSRISDEGILRSAMPSKPLAPV